MATRPVRDTPSEFELYALNAILSLQQRQQAEQDQPAQSTDDAQAVTSILHDEEGEHPRSSGALPVAVDKGFPTPLLKCPRAVFTAFVAKYKLSSRLIEALSAARRRKANRRLKRISRNRRAKFPSKHVNPESDDEGDCAAIDDVAVYAQLMAIRF